MLKATLSYDRGTILIKGLAHMPFATLDPRVNLLRAQALYYSSIVEYLKQSGIQYDDYVFADALPSPPHYLSKEKSAGGGDNNNGGSNDQSLPMQLRDYQQKALGLWAKAGMRGCVVLPTGSGKTLVGMSAIERVNAPSLVVVPTLDLMDQWSSVLAKHFLGGSARERNSAAAARIGSLGGGSDDIQPITVSTYDSAYIRAPALGNRFSLVIFDEVHHLAAPGYRTIAEQMAAPYRLGLTATIEREDNLHADLPRLVGEVVFQASPDSLARKRHLAPYEIERRRVEMLPEELEEYRRNMAKYEACLVRLGLGRMRRGGREGGATINNNYAVAFQKLIMMSARNSTAREGLLARNRAMEVALNSRAKLDELKEILAENRGARTIIFTQHNSLVHEISDRLLVPSITHKTGREERQNILSGFREGRYSAIVTSKVLDEGIDVPDAELGIILSGTGSAREFIQRLGRLLRPKPGTGNKKARLVEIVSSETREVGTSAKRKRALGRMESVGGGDGVEEEGEGEEGKEQDYYGYGGYDGIYDDDGGSGSSIVTAATTTTATEGDGE